MTLHKAYVNSYSFYLMDTSVKPALTSTLRQHCRLPLKLLADCQSLWMCWHRVALTMLLSPSPCPQTQCCNFELEHLEILVFT